LEAGIPNDEALSGLRMLAYNYQLKSGDRDAQLALLKRYAPTLICGLTAVGNTKYDGEYWPEVGKAAQLLLSAADQSLFGTAFQSGLERFRLSRFETPQRYVGEILMHAGIPVPSLRGFLLTLQRRERDRPGLRGTDVCDWAASMTAKEAREGGKFDAPTWRFLSHGRDIAVDFVDRVLDVMDALSGTEALLLNALGQLPRATGVEIDRLIRAGELNVWSRRQTLRSKASAPRITYNDGGIRIKLPRLDAFEGQRVTWRFVSDGSVRLRNVDAWFPGDPVVDDHVEIDSPVISIGCSIEHSHYRWNLDVIDHASNLLVFERSTGELISPRSYLPRDRVLVALPNANDLDSSELIEYEPATADSPVLGDLGSPSGWTGWSVFEARLNGITRIRAKGCPSWRFVSTIARPTLAEPRTIPYLKTEARQEIYATSPSVTLPPTEQRNGEVRSEEWIVAVHDSTGACISEVVSRIGQQPMTVDPWINAPSPRNGVYEIRTRPSSGALGRRWAFPVAVIERCWATATPEFRRIDETGRLESAKVRVTLDGKHSTVGILAGEDGAHHVISRDGVRTPVIVQVDHMAIGCEIGGHRSKDGIAALDLDLEAIPASIINVKLQPGRKGTVELSRGQEVIQQDEIIANAAGRARVALGQFSASMTSNDAFEILLISEGQRVSRLATVRPQKLVESWSLAGHVLTLERVSQTLDLELLITIDSAPWRPPEKIRLEPGVDSTRLPDHVFGKGSFSAQARIFDPWNTEEMGLAPENRHSFSGLFVSQADGVEEQFIRFVVGIDPIPDTPEALKFSIRHYPSIALLPDEDRERVYDQVAHLSEVYRSQFADFIHSTTWTRQHHTRLLVEGSPATAPARKRPIYRETWQMSPYLGVLESIERRADPLLEDQIRSTLGESAWSILVAGKDPDARVGAFNRDVSLLAERPPALRHAIIQAAQVVPGRFLDRDQRVSHAMLLFEQREAPRLVSLIRRSRGIINEATELIAERYPNASFEPIAKLWTVPEWQALPPASLALAFMARLAARSSQEARYALEANRACFVDLAVCAPEFSEQCLVIAELWLQHWEMKGK